MRVISLFLGTLPMIMIVCFMPFIGLYNGDVQLPDILLSDLYASKPIYAAFFLFGYCSCASTAAFSFVEYSRFLREKSKKLGVPAGLISVLLIFVILPNLYLLLGFQFEETHEEGQNFYLDIWAKPWSQLVPWFIHVVSATILFISFGLCSAVYLVFIYPHIKDGATEPMADVISKKWFCSSLATIVPIAAFVRILHITHSRYVWAIPLLLGEISMISIAGMLVMVGNMETMKLMDKQYPILTLRGFADLFLGDEFESGENPLRIEEEEVCVGDENRKTTVTGRKSSTGSQYTSEVRMRKDVSQKVVIQNINVIATDSINSLKRCSEQRGVSGAMLLTSMDRIVDQDKAAVYTSDEDFENAKELKE